MTRFWPLLPPVFALVLLAAGWWMLSRPGPPADGGATVALPALQSLAAAPGPDGTPPSTGSGAGDPVGDPAAVGPVTLTDTPSGRFSVVIAGEVLADPRPGANVLGVVGPGDAVTVSGATPDGRWLFVGCETCGEVGGYVGAGLVATAIPAGAAGDDAPVLGFDDIAGLWCGSESLAFTRADITIVAADGGLRVDGIGEYRFFEDRVRVFGPAPDGGTWVAEFGHFVGDAMVYLRARPADTQAWSRVGRRYRRC